MMSIKVVYLAGPISDINIQDAVVWREEAEEKLEAANIVALNPLRGKNLDDENVNINLDAAEVVERDLEDTYISDIVLVDLRREVSIIGTAMEIMYAKQLGRKVFAFGKAYKNHYWIRYYTDERFENLDEAIEAIVKEVG